MKYRFKDLPFKFNLQRYSTEAGEDIKFSDGSVSGVGGGFSRTLWECDPASAAFTCDDLTLGCPSKTYPGGVFLPRGLTARWGSAR
jgi:hypothetical protein